MLNCRLRSVCFHRWVHEGRLELLSATKHESNENRDTQHTRNREEYLAILVLSSSKQGVPGHSVASVTAMTVGETRTSPQTYHYVTSYGQQ